MKQKRFCITFTGAVGTSKTPIAYYLSIKFGLPIFNNDGIRKEVMEDMGKRHSGEFKKRREKRLKELTATKQSFIFDASVDRQWLLLRKYLQKNNYSWFIISLDLSKKMIKNFYHLKNYRYALSVIDKYLDDHQKFLEQYGSEVKLHINDQDFKRRLNLSYRAVKKWLK